MPEKRRDPTPHRQSGHAGNTRPHGPGGINIRDHVERPWGRSNDRNDREHHSTYAGDNHRDGGKIHRSRSRSSHHSDDKHGGSKKEGRGDSASGSKKHKPPHRSPSPAPSKGGGGGGGRRRSNTPERGTGHPDDEDYDNQYFGPKCFMDRIREQSIPKGINTMLPGDNRPYDGSGQPEIWIDEFFNAVRAFGGICDCRLSPLTELPDWTGALLV